MRTLRLSLTGAVMLLLLGSLSAVAIAQSGQQGGPVTFVSGQLLSVSTDDSDEDWSVEDTVGHARGFKVTEVYEWSDPRLPADKVTTINMDMYAIGQSRETVFTAATILEGPDGYWTGSGTGFLDPDGVYRGAEVLSGHGAYDGLSAIITFTDLDEAMPGTGDGAEGFIFEGEMPPMPEPIDPAGE